MRVRARVRVTVWFSSLCREKKSSGGMAVSLVRVRVRVGVGAWQ